VDSGKFGDVKKAPKKVPKKAPIEQPRVFRWEPFWVPFFHKIAYFCNIFTIQYIRKNITIIHHK